MTRLTVQRIPTLALALTLLAGTAASAQARPDEGKLWMLRQYRVPMCEPMPRLPTVFDWLLRKALAIERFLATSVDCGEVGRRGAREGWSYIFWTQQEETAASDLIRKARERFGLTALIPRRIGQAWSEHAESYEPFVLVQLPGESSPMRLWASGHSKLVTTTRLNAAGAFELEVRSETSDGRVCSARLVPPEDLSTAGRTRLVCSPRG